MAKSHFPTWGVDGPNGKTAHLMNFPNVARCGHVFANDAAEAAAGTKTCKRCVASGALGGHPGMPQRPDLRNAT